MKTLIVLLASMTLALAAERPDSDARRSARQADIDARVWRQIVKQSKDKPDAAAYLSTMKAHQDSIAAKRAAHDKEVSDRAKKQKPVK